MANEAKYIEGTKLNLETSGALIANDAFVECTDDDRQPADDAGYPLGLFEFTTASASPFSTAPTAGAVINLYEQKINSAGSDAPDVDSNYKNDYIGSFIVDLDNSAQQFLTIIAPIHPDGGKYWLEWVDGGAGTATIDATWKLDLTPITYGPA